MLEVFDLRLLNVGYDPIGENWQWKDVCSPFARIYLIDGGSASLILEDKEIELKPGHLYLIPPFKKHSCIGNKGFIHYYIHLYEWPGIGAGIFNEYDFFSEVRAQQGDKEIFQMLVNLFPENQLNVSDPEIYDNYEELNTSCCNFSQRPPCERMLAKGSMLVLISRFLTSDAEKRPRHDPKIAKVCGYINTHISSDLSLQSLSEIACMSESHFLRVFKKEMGMTPAQYIIQHRIETAQLLLLLDKEPVKNIALTLGFSDPSHFVKTFKKIKGMTPNEFRMRSAPDLAIR
ncbi:MAG: AraC family transcriptional regulator [Muribaculaceae bacterium]|nr:AraC family transcriptional regulator [Muribaculaceae bacterium]